MRSAFLILIFLLCIHAPSVAQESGVGSASRLSGKIYVLTVFVESDRWSEEEKGKEINKVFEAENWLQRQARRYNVEISFENGAYGQKDPIIIPDFPVGRASGQENTELVSMVLGKIGYRNPLQFLEWVKANTTCDNALVLILSDKSGIGYAMPYISGVDTEKYTLEGCVLYRTFPNGMPLGSNGVAHEFLHLFGAWDLYHTFQQSKEKADKAQQLFPNDIMLRATYNMDELEIDRLTAWLVGLTTLREPWFDWFKP